MKHLFLISASFLILTCSNAQITKGTKILGANINASVNSGKTPSSASYSYDNSSRNMNLGISPSAGYFFKDNIAIGLGIGYAYAHSLSEAIPTVQQSYYTTSSKSFSNSFNINPYYRYYIRLTDKLYYFTNAALSCSYEMGKGKSYVLDLSGNENNINKSSSTGIRLGTSISPGGSYFITDKLAIELSVGSLYYNYSKGKSTNSNGTSIDKGWNQNAGINLTTSSINLGLRYFIRKKE